MNYEDLRKKAKELHNKLHFIKKDDRIIRRIVFHYFLITKKYKFIMVVFFLIFLSELIFFLLIFITLWYLGKKNKKIKGWPPKEMAIQEKIEYFFEEVPLYLVILHYVTVWITFFFFVFFM